MNVHIRFRKSFESYRQGESHRLPDDIADIYLRAGVAELVDHVPVKEAVPEEPAAPAEPEQATEEATPDDDDGDDKPAGKSKRKRS